MRTSGKRPVIFQTSEWERGTPVRTQSQGRGVASFSLATLRLCSASGQGAVSLSPKPSMNTSGKRAGNTGGSHGAHSDHRGAFLWVQGPAISPRLHGGQRPKFPSKFHQLLCLSKQRWRGEDCTEESTCRQRPRGRGPPVLSHSYCLEPTPKYPISRLRGSSYSDPKEGVQKRGPRGTQMW